MSRVAKNITDEHVAELYSYAQRFPQLIGIHGWLLFFSLLILLSIIGNFYGAIEGFTNPIQYTKSVLALYPSLTGFITFSNSMQLLIALGGIFVAVHILIRGKHTRRIASIYFTVALIYAALETVLGFLQYGDNSIVLNAAFKGGGQISMIIYSTVLLAYFLGARRVRATFDGTQHIDPGTTSENIKEVSSLSRKDGKFEKQLEKLEDIAVELDRACRDGEVSEELIKEATKYVVTVGDSITDSKSVAERAYIVYEVRALLMWVKHEESKARALAVTAAETKGDDVLFTQTANMIVRS